MRKKNYKGMRCTKRSLQKCKGVCKTFDAIQERYASKLNEDDDVKSFQVNVLLQGAYEDAYMTDFLVERNDGAKFVRECVWRSMLSRPSVATLLDMSRNYWRAKGIEDWGIVVEATENIIVEATENIFVEGEDNENEIESE